MEFEIEPQKSIGCAEPPNLCRVDILHEHITYNDFFQSYMRLNRPCVIKNVTDSWECRQKWLNNNNEINLDYLTKTYGSCDVTVYNCDERHFNSQKTTPYKFSNYIEDFWRNGRENRMYLKDWHLKNQHPNDNFYAVPLYFASDWLNEYLVGSGLDDYRFVYMGKSGTWTPFHSDVFSSFSWSVNVCGRKKWIFLPPGEEDCLRDHLQNLPYDVSELYETCNNYVEVVQNAGDAVFVPSGWHHQVWNLEDTISVNHNWINGCNVAKMWHAMRDDLKLIKKEIEDCTDMEDYLNHCQVMLKASFGMNFYDFYKFIAYIGEKRIDFLYGRNNSALFHEHKIGTNHALFDLQAIVSVVEMFLEHSDVEDLFNSHNNSPGCLLNTLRNITLV